MAKDHYVAQTYLRSFGLSEAPDFVNVIRKSNLTRQNAIPVKSVCYEVDWSSNEFFPDNPRVVEDYLKLFEPRWADCIQKISTDTYDTETKYLMAGYIAYLRACTPTAARLGSHGLAHIVQDLYNKIEEDELSNPETQYKSVIEEIRRSGGTKVEINEAYPKALGVNSLVDAQKLIAASPWIVFKNETSKQLLTSDNPVCLKYWNATQCDLYCPLTPNLAIVIHPLHDTEPREIDRVGALKSEGVDTLNRLMVQSAEDKVIFNDSPDAENFAKEYQDWRVELLTLNIPTGTGNLLIAQQRPVKREASEAHAK